MSFPSPPTPDRLTARILTVEAFNPRAPVELACLRAGAAIRNPAFRAPLSARKMEGGAGLRDRAA